MLAGVPLANYGPRGSDQSINNIADVLERFQPIKAVLLENHGVLAFADSLEGAIRANITVEEAAEICLYAESLGGVKPIPAEMLQATTERAESFAAAGTYSSKDQSA